MSAAYARSDFIDENLHQRDGSLLKKKREQWAKERAELEKNSWFPFGSPGGGAPNKKYEAISPVQSDKPDNRPSSCRSNGDSGRWSDSENVGPNKEIVDQDTHHPEFGYPYMAASTSSATSTVYIPTAPQLPEGAGFRGLAQLAAPPAAFVAPSGAPVPVQLVCSPGASTQAVPVELAQTSTPPYPFMYPLRLVPSAQPSCSTSHVALDEQRPEMSMLTSSYTERWADQLPYWRTASICKEDVFSPKDVTPVAFPPVSATQPLAVVRPMVIPVIPSRPELTFPLVNLPGSDDVVHGSMSESSTSLNSSCRRNESESKGRESLLEHAISEQIAEKERAEKRRIEEERKEALKKENERKRMEEAERIRALEEERRKKDAEEEQRRKEEAVLVAIEKAEQEAEKCRKLRLYKHVLDSPDNSELQHSILGFDDTMNVKIFKEVESLERQKKYEMQTLEKTPRSLSRRRSGETGVAQADRRHISLSGERYIRDTPKMNNSYGECAVDEVSVGFNRRGRQSLRLPSSAKPVQKQRSNSLERRFSGNAKELQSPKTSAVRRPALNCTIPVLPQRRIPPPSGRIRRPSVDDNGPVSSSSPQEFFSYEVVTDVISLAECPAPSKSFDEEFKISEKPKKGNGIELCHDYLFPATSVISRHRPDVPELKKISTARFQPVTARRASHDALSLLTDIPLPDDKKVSAKRRSSHQNDDLLQNPLFQPVATRCRRSKTTMDNSEQFRASSSSGSGSPALSASDEKSSPTPVVKVSSVECGEAALELHSENAKQCVVMNGLSVQNKNLVNGDDSRYSPFKKKLANTNVLSRYREDDLLSPEIKRRGEGTPSASLRSSLANLSVDGSDDGRTSPASPHLQRFNSKTSQYRSLNLKNLKKVTDRNQKVLERLAELRSRLQNQSVGTVGVRSPPANLAVNGNDDDQKSSVSPHISPIYNSRMSQYHCQNLTDRNRNVTEHLGELRLQPQQNHSAERDGACRRTLLNRSPRRLAVTETPRKSSESVTAV